MACLHHLSLLEPEGFPLSFETASGAQAMTLELSATPAAGALIRGVLAVSLLVPVMAMPAAAASFDCERTDLAADETAICDNRALNDADVKMVTTFDILTSLLAMGNRDTLREEQSAWLKKRQACGADVACLTGAYEERMEALGQAFEGLSRPL
jgi:uncharacterized protein